VGTVKRLERGQGKISADILAFFAMLERNTTIIIIENNQVQGISLIL
jgi:hypothetical protein